MEDDAASESEKSPADSPRGEPDGGRQWGLLQNDLDTAILSATGLHSLWGGMKHNNILIVRVEEVDAKDTVVDEKAKYHAFHVLHLEHFGRHQWAFRDPPLNKDSDRENSSA